MVFCWPMIVTVGICAFLFGGIEELFKRIGMKLPTLKNCLICYFLIVICIIIIQPPKIIFLHILVNTFIGYAPGCILGIIIVKLAEKYW